MLYRETIAVYCENHTEHTSTLSGQIAEFYYVKASGIYSNHSTLKVFKRMLSECEDMDYIHLGRGKVHGRLS
jgi:hypothetical protein